MSQCVIMGCLGAKDISFESPNVELLESGKELGVASSSG